MSKYLGLLLLLTVLMLGSVAAQTVKTTTSYSITVTVTPGVASVNLSPTSVSTPTAANAGAVVGTVTVTTNPPGGSYTGAITLGGTDAAKFALSNGGVLPCNLVVGPANVPAGNYAITLSAN